MSTLSPMSVVKKFTLCICKLCAMLTWNSHIIMLTFLAAAMMPEFCANQTYGTVAWYFAMAII
jgi:hypothetical protein